MKQSLVQTLTQGGHSYGQVSDPRDLMKAQDFAHSRLSGAINDFVNNSKDQEITGHSYLLAGGLSITVKRPGRVYTKDGVSYDLLADTTLTFDAAHSSYPRIDLVVATLDDEMEAETGLIPFVRLRTADEFSENAQPYAPGNLNAARELHWRAVPQIIKGTPTPNDTVPPAHASNQVPLYLVAIAPGATLIRAADILDLRDIVFPVRKLNELVADSKAGLANLVSRVTRLENLPGQTIDLSQVFGEIKSLGNILSEHQAQINAARDVPEIRFERPKVPLTDINSSKIVATGGAAAGVPYVDIPLGGRVNFGDAEVTLQPQNFPSGVSARFEKTAGGSATTKRDLSLALSQVTQTASDGFSDFVERSSIFDAARARPACAARNSQYIEIFGGLASDNASRLADWFTYDIVNDTLTARIPGSTLPSAERPALFPYGDGTNVLLIAGSESDDTPACFKVNASTMAVTAISGTKPSGIQFVGDLVSAGKIFIVALNTGVDGVETEFWEFDTGTNLFTQLSASGSVPSPEIDLCGGCYYAPNKFVFVTFAPSETSSGQTYVFDRTSLQWTKLNVTQPYADSPTRQLPVSRFRLANVNNRPLLIGGLLNMDSDATRATVWELKDTVINDEKTLGWQRTNATFLPVQDPGFCSTLSNGLPSGKAFFFAGQGKYSDAKKRIYSSVLGGLIATAYQGADGVSIADSSTFVQFEVPAFTAEWNVIGYWLNLQGRFAPGDLKIEVSLDNGTHWHEISANGKTLTVDDSATPGVRRVRITMYRNPTRQPILTGLNEILNQNGAVLEDHVVLRYNSPNAERGVYIDRKGVVTFEASVVPSTPDKCLLHKVTPNGSSAPTLTNYINRRRAHFKYEGTAGSGPTTIQFKNVLAVPARFVDARAIKASDKSIYKIADPTVTFDGTIDVAGVTTGDSWIVEVEG